MTGAIVWAIMRINWAGDACELLRETANPAVGMAFLHIAAFESKGIAELLHSEEPELADYEKDVVEWVNLMIEVCDNTPGKEKGRGVRIAPPRVGREGVPDCPSAESPMKGYRYWALSACPQW